MINKKADIGLRLKDFAEKNFSTFADFARAMGKDVTYFTNYYKGKSILGGESLAKLAELGCDINWLLNGEKKINKNLIHEKTEQYMTYTDLNQKLEHLQNENTQLKVENYDLRKERDQIAKQVEELKTEIEQLQKELKK